MYPPRGDRHPSPLPADTAEPRPEMAGAFSLGARSLSESPRHRSEKPGPFAG